MKTVGVRELKDRLSEYLRTVRAGETVLVTDRGEVVAALAPPGQPASDPDVPVGVVALAKRGHLRLSSRRKSRALPALKPLRGARTSAELLDESRGER